MKITDQTSASVRWEAFKAFFRSQVISFTSLKYKSHRLEMEQLERSINEIETLKLEIGLQSPCHRLISELHKLRAKYNVLSTNKATKGLMRLRQSYYKQVEKAIKLLAWGIKQMQAEKSDSQIRA